MDSVTTREPVGADGADAAAEERAASLLDRWQAHHDGASAAPSADDGRDSDSNSNGEPDVVAVPHLPDGASVSTLDAARARRDGPPEDEPPLAEPIPLRPPAEAEPAPTAETTAAPEPDHAHLDAVRRPKHAAPRPATSSMPTTDSVAAGREVLDALGLADTASTAPPQHAAPKPSPVPVPPAPAPAAAPRTGGGRRSPSSAPEVGRSLDVDFPPKLAARRVVALLLLLALAATAGAGYLAYEDPRPITLGGAGTLLALTLLLYAIRAGSAPTYLTVRSGQLEVRRGKTLEKFDLTSRFTRIEVVGTPGRPGWKVLLGRFGRDPLVISASIVDPKAFTAELERYRPQA